MKNMKIWVKSSIIVAILLLIGFFVLWKVVDSKSSKMVGDQITNQMTDAVESREAVIENYVSSAEEFMVAFSLSDEVKNALRYSNNEKYIQIAQEYTQEYAKVKGVFEGLYIASPITQVLTHTTPQVVGIRTRDDDALPEFQKQIFIKDKLTNLGIMKSPSSGNMVISMYYPVFDNDKCIGYVGAAVLASNLMESLEALEIKGMPDSEYIFLNTTTKEYLYNDDEELLCTETEDKGCLKMIDKIEENDDETTGMIEYEDEDGVNQIIVYRNIPERGWVFALKDKKSNVYSSLEDIRKTTGFMCLVVGIIVVIAMINVLVGIGIKLKFISSSIEKLGNMDMTIDDNVHKYANRTDEIGITCKALEKTSENISLYINEVGRQLSDMANGDFSKKSNVKFAGEFKKLNESMDQIQTALNSAFGEIRTVTGELVLGSRSVAQSASQLADAARESTTYVMEIDDNVTEISQNVDMTANLAQRASEESEEASQLVKSSRDKMQDLQVAMKHIAQSSGAIEKICTTLEQIANQTNILSLNALVEAGRAGDSGKGFAVVANEIRMLAEQSSKASADSYNIIQETVVRIEEGIKCTQEATQYLEKVVTQTNTIDTSVSQIAQATQSQNTKLIAIRDRLHEIEKTVRITADMSDLSASASIQLDSQTKVMDENINRFIL